MAHLTKYTKGQGSLPRVRERRYNGIGSFIQDGFTPACAGKTNINLIKISLHWVHSRVCGKDKRTAFSKASLQGSLPRVRERPQFLFLMISCFGFTPACAGKTGKKSRQIKVLIFEMPQKSAL